MAALAEAVQKGQGLGGRLRKAADDREKVRKAVTNAVRRTLADIGKYDSALSEHLKPPRLRRGGQLCYVPPGGVVWET